MSTTAIASVRGTFTPTGGLKIHYADVGITGADEFHYSERPMCQQFRFASERQSRSSRLLAERSPASKHRLCRFGSNTVVMSRAAASDELGNYAEMSADFSSSHLQKSRSITPSAAKDHWPDVCNPYIPIAAEVTWRFSSAKECDEGGPSSSRA